ncbi:hypothetical protein Bca52824_027867 [Brassica carinata]|uniref:Uncharacterized protein n=1 Tax=Brassica carinata TaxID=52824 RepID=A0A8X7VBD5_BRACI|nr:hypothetical protein Bca52824_027867 [Brassica carinata]
MSTSNSSATYLNTTRANRLPAYPDLFLRTSLYKPGESNQAGLTSWSLLPSIRNLEGELPALELIE